MRSRRGIVLLCVRSVSIHLLEPTVENIPQCQLSLSRWTMMMQSLFLQHVKQCCSLQMDTRWSGSSRPTRSAQSPGKRPHSTIHLHADRLLSRWVIWLQCRVYTRRVPDARWLFPHSALNLYLIPCQPWLSKTRKHEHVVCRVLQSGPGSRSEASTIIRGIKHLTETSTSNDALQEMLTPAQHALASESPQLRVLGCDILSVWLKRQEASAEITQPVLLLIHMLEVWPNNPASIAST